MSGARQVVRRLGWGVVDQGVSSVSNFALGAVAAHVLGPGGFGAFSLAYLAYALLLNATRGVATDPLVVRFSTAEPATQRAAVAAATATSVCVGTVASAGSLVVGLVTPGAVGAGFLALALWLPFLLLQDAWRFAFFAGGSPKHAMLNDAAWGVLQVALIGAFAATGHDSVGWCVTAFGAGSAAAAALGALQAGIRPDLRRVRSWVADNRDLGGRYFIENLSIGGARQLRFLALGAFGGLAAVGATRGAEMLMGPFLVMLMGVSQVAVPEGAHVLARAPHRLWQFCLAVGSAAAGLAACWGLAVGLFLPDGAGDLLLGDVWPSADALLLPVALGMVAGGYEIGAAAGLRALGAARRSLVAQLSNAILYAAGGALGAYLGQAAGSCWGIAIANVIAASQWWWHLHRGVTDHLAPSATPIPEGARL